MSQYTNSWPDERIEAMKKLWEAGLSSSQMAAELSGPPFQSYPYLSRNAVIGKIHRMGLVGRVKSAAAGPIRLRKPRNTQVRGKNFISVAPQKRSAAALALEPASEINVDLDPAAVSAFDNVIPIIQRVTLLDLTDATCRWPIGDPQHPDFAFCGGRSLTGLPYCAHHTRISLAPAADRRRRRYPE